MGLIIIELVTGKLLCGDVFGGVSRIFFVCLFVCFVAYFFAVINVVGVFSFYLALFFLFLLYFTFFDA